jgi:hypothetical protein
VGTGLFFVPGPLVYFRGVGCRPFPLIASNMARVTASGPFTSVGVQDAAEKTTAGIATAITIFPVCVIRATTSSFSPVKKHGRTSCTLDGTGEAATRAGRRHRGAEMVGSVSPCPFLHSSERVFGARASRCGE